MHNMFLFHLFQLVSKGFGYVLTYLVLLGFRSIIGLNGVALAFASVPAAGFLGLFFTGREKYVHYFYYLHFNRFFRSRIEKANTDKSSVCGEIVKSFKIPITSPSVYRPLALGITIEPPHFGQLCVQERGRRGRCWTYY